MKYKNIAFTDGDKILTVRVPKIAVWICQTFGWQHSWTDRPKGKKFNYLVCDEIVRGKDGKN